MEAREDGGTPGILQTLKAALCIRLKETMGTANILKREQQLTQILLTELTKIPKLHILQGDVEERLGIISFEVEDIHYNLIVKILNDRFGIQVRGGCSCAGTYGHYLLDINHTASKKMTDKIDQGDLSERAGWVRVSLHPTMTTEEVYQIAGAIKMTADHIKEWQTDYVYHPRSNSFTHKRESKQFSKKDFFEI
jgi:selenocysteine lyase/cysteine desulfurase